MNEIEKMKYRIQELQKRLETNSRMQRNYQRNKHGEIKEKLEKEAVKYISLINKLRDELKVIEKLENKKLEKEIKKMNIVAIGEEIIVVG